MPDAPPSAAATLARATRVKTTPLILAPVLVGAALAAERTGRFSWAVLGLSLAGAAAMHLAAMVVNDIFDARSGADRIAGMDRTGIVTASGVIDAGDISPRGMTLLAGVLYAVAAVIGVVLAIDRGSALLVFGIAGAALAVGYVAPPVRYGYRGHGLGEAGLFAAYGLLPVAGAFTVQAGELPAEAWWAGVVPGLLTMLVYDHGNLLHHRADKAVGKMTPAAILGPEGALLVGVVVIVAAEAGLIIQVALGLFPPGALAGLVAGIPMVAAWTRAFRDPNPQRILNLLGTSLGAAVLTGAVIAAALALR